MFEIDVSRLTKKNKAMILVFVFVFDGVICWMQLIVIEGLKIVHEPLEIHSTEKAKVKNIMVIDWTSLHKKLPVR